ncbi:hypothetical protein [Streptomyces sp. NPDC001652]|uniref:T4 family baseplate hub assembly chaperone n=1 Tax=Streptomyces sp. NPDC001652 TaxID=3154393 RepID=UPI003333CC1C
MRGLSAPEVLDLWERTECLGPVDCALALAAAAARGAGQGDGSDDVGALAALPLGVRDALLLRLRCATFGRVLEARACCPRCGENVEFTVDGHALSELADRPLPTPAPLDVAGCRVTWRPVDSADLAAAGRAGDPGAAVLVLLSRCVTGAHDSAAQPQDLVNLPAQVRAAVAEAMAQGDPLAEILIDLSCPGCGTAFVSDLDIGAFVRAELRGRALRLLHEVDVLARAYGWREHDVLGLSDARRAAYLGMAIRRAP